MAESQIKYSLVELIYLAELSQNTERKDWAFLNADLLEGMDEVKVEKKEENVAQRNVFKVLDKLYQKPLHELSSRYGIDKKVQKVLDLYYLTQKEIEGIAYTHHAPCGKRTFQRINDILTSHNLPALHEVS